MSDVFDGDFGGVEEECEGSAPTLHVAFDGFAAGEFGGGIAADEEGGFGGGVGGGGGGLGVEEGVEREEESDNGKEEFFHGRASRLEKS